MATKPNIVLVHGAWGDGSHWRHVIPHLHRQGFRVAAVQNPLTSLAEDIDRTSKLVADQDGPTLGRSDLLTFPLRHSFRSWSPRQIGEAFPGWRAGSWSTSTVWWPRASLQTHGPYVSAKSHRRATYRFASPQLIWSQWVFFASPR